MVSLQLNPHLILRWFQAVINCDTGLSSGRHHISMKTNGMMLQNTLSTLHRFRSMFKVEQRLYLRTLLRLIRKPELLSAYEVAAKDESLAFDFFIKNSNSTLELKDYYRMKFDYAVEEQSGTKTEQKKAWKCQIWQKFMQKLITN